LAQSKAYSTGKLKISSENPAKVRPVDGGGGSDRKIQFNFVELWADAL